MQYGMAICAYTLGNCPDNNELFFTTITQINHGGPGVVSDPNQRSILAKLNLRAGKLSIELSDYASALSLFEHGISYLGDDKWDGEYELTLNLFDAAAEAAGVLNKNEAVTSYTKELVANAKSFDDSLNCKYSSCILVSEYDICCGMLFMMKYQQTIFDFTPKPINHTYRFSSCCQVASSRGAS